MSKTSAADLRPGLLGGYFPSRIIRLAFLPAIFLGLPHRAAKPTVLNYEDIGKNCVKQPKKS